MTYDTQRTELQRLREETNRKAATLAQEANISTWADSRDEADLGNAALQREQADALLYQTRRRLDEIISAQKRLENGTYGICENCAKLIPEARLEFIPSARTCVACS